MHSFSQTTTFTSLLCLALLGLVTACSPPMPLSDCQRYKLADNLFRGKILSIGGNDGTSQAYTVEVIEIFKTTPGSTLGDVLGGQIGQVIDMSSTLIDLNPEPGLCNTGVETLLLDAEYLFEYLNIGSVLQSIIPTWSDLGSEGQATVSECGVDSPSETTMTAPATMTATMNPPPALATPTEEVYSAGYQGHGASPSAKTDCPESEKKPTNAGAKYVGSMADVKDNSEEHYDGSDGSYSAQYIESSAAQIVMSFLAAVTLALVL